MVHTVALTPAQTEPKPVRITRKMMYLLLDAGLLEEKTELVDGILYHKMPHTPEHIAGIRRTLRYANAAFGESYVFSQTPMKATEDGEPEPDVFVTEKPDTAYPDMKPSSDDVVLVVEVSNHTLEMDRITKARLYAYCGIVDYWVLDVVERVLIVHRVPTDEGYESISILLPHEGIAPLAKPAACILIADLLP